MAQSRTPRRSEPSRSARRAAVSGQRPADGGDRAAPAFASLAPDALEYVAAQPVGGRIGETGDAVHLGDGGAGGAHRCRRGPGVWRAMR